MAFSKASDIADRMVAKKKGAKPGAEPDDEGAPLEEACQTLMDAMKSGKAAAVASALRDAVALVK